MHVLNVNHTLDPVTGGGTAERTLKMSQFLANAGVTCTVIAASIGFEAAGLANQPNLKFVTVPLLSKRFFIPRIASAMLDKLVSEADVIHLMGHWSIFNAMVYSAARRLGKPYVICPAGALPIYGRSKFLKRLYNVFIGKNIVRNASAKIAITDSEREHFAAYGVDPETVVLIPNGVDTSEHPDADPSSFRAKYALDQHPFILFMGRLNTIKGPDLLLAAFCAVQKTYPDWHLVYAGPDAGLLKSLQEKVRNEGLEDRIHFVGYVGGTDKASAYLAAALLAIPSRQEAMSIVVLEAAIRKTPVLLTDQCGMNMVSEFGGKVVPATAEGLQSGLRELLSAADELKHRGELLADFVRSRYLWSNVVQAYIAQYQRLVQKRTA